MITQYENYQRDGYLIIEDFISDDMCDRLIKQANQLIEKFEPRKSRAIFSTKHHELTKQQYFLDSGDNIHFFFEEDAFDDKKNLRKEKKFCINKIGHALHKHDNIFADFSRSSMITDMLKNISITDPRIMQSMYICKQANFGGEVTCHQDSTFLYVNGQPITGLWFALEDATIENGCLWAIPGGHHGTLKSRMIRKNNNEIVTDTYDPSPWDLTKMIPLEVKRGSMIVIHGLLPHMSKENISTRSRHAYTLHVMSSKDEFAKDNWLQQDVLV
tara:strand:+ start:1050 stop:1865 length:816 start_codon:yes stop_codon:yes gene_type:complete